MKVTSVEESAQPEVKQQKLDSILMPSDTQFDTFAAGADSLMVGKVRLASSSFGFDVLCL